MIPCCDATDTRAPRTLGQGIAALEDNDFARAEEIFARVLRYNGNNVTARFYMGVAKMNLGKWDEATRYLRGPARELRKLPDPKTHLGVTYAKLGDASGARTQRAHLVKMAEACGGACELSPYIIKGIQMIDDALAETPAPNQG
jgi:Flp pilus assembly protein TadD